MSAETALKQRRNSQPLNVARPGMTTRFDVRNALLNGAALGYALLGYVAGFCLMATTRWWVSAFGVALTAHAMLIAAYLVHEAVHQNLFLGQRPNRVAGEVMSFLAGGSYASYDRIRDLHLCHHVERLDVVCFDYKAFLRRRAPWVRRAFELLEWAYVPAVEILMHVQVVVRPWVDRTQRAHLPRVVFMLVVRLALFAWIAVTAPRAAALYFIAYGLLVIALGFFDAFQHTYENYALADVDHAPRRDRDYERAHTYSNAIAPHHPWVDLLILNFGYHNAHHEKMGVPWHRLPALHRQLFSDAGPEFLPASELLRTFHRNRVRRIWDEEYGAVGVGPGRADRFVGAHGVSFLTVV
jgi:fatty acid desaturase